MSVTALKVQIGSSDDAPIKTFRGRDAWALNELLQAGDRGITTFQNPAPRLSHYLHKIRRQGVVIDTIFEAHAGAYKGRHGRYVLRSTILVLERKEAA
jgi:hypothetical protein